MGSFTFHAAHNNYTGDHIRQNDAAVDQSTDDMRSNLSPQSRSTTSADRDHISRRLPLLTAWGMVNTIQLRLRF